MNESLVAKALNGAEKYFQPSLGRVRSHEVLDHRKWVFSEVWRIKLNFQTGKKYVFFKHHLGKPSPDPDRSVEREYHILRHLTDRFSSSQDHLNVIRPIVVLPKERVLVTEEFLGEKLQGVILDELLWRSTQGQKRCLQRYLSSCGQWLRKL